MIKESNLAPFGKNLNYIIKRVINSNEKEIVLSSLAGSAAALFISLFFERSSAPLLVVAESYAAAEDFKKDLGFFLDESSINFFPDWDTVPYDNQSPDKDVLGLRFQTLRDILNERAGVTVTTPNALTRRITPPSAFIDACLDFEISRTYSRSRLPQTLTSMGYRRVEQVEEKGEFAVRGDIIDIFSLTEPHPARLDFFDDELESVKYFDAETQRSTETLSSLSLSPAAETLYVEGSVDRLLRQTQALKPNSSFEIHKFLEERIRETDVFPGVENFLPFFYPEVSSLTDYYTRPPVIVFLEKSAIKERSKLFFEEACSEYEYSLKEGHPAPEPELLFLTPNLLFEELKRFSAIDIQALDFETHKNKFSFSTVDNTAVKSLAVSDGADGKSFGQNILDQLEAWHREGAKIIIAAGSHSKADRIRQIMEDRGLSLPVRDDKSGKKQASFLTEDFSADQTSFIIVPDSPDSGFRWVSDQGESKTVLITEEEIFGVRQKQKTTKKANLKNFFASLEDLKVGDHVVHVEYGIGKYQGLQKLQIGDAESDFLVLIYQNNDKVYVPVDKFHLVQKHIGGEEEKTKVNKLGGKVWAKTKSKIKAAIDDIAEEIITVNAERKAKKGVAFSPDSSLMNEFALSFPYQETEDQERAIKEVMEDMESKNPMDRLVCGDVGFGKTEVAMRAACKAAIDGYQTGILTPTTILAQQHHNSFRKRFEDIPVKIGLLSRFQAPKQIKKTLKELKEGKIDIVIGTHRLLSKDVEFKKLGLLVIDEEQRFGVKHKEKLKQYRATVDILTLSATPIPRTLHMSFVGIRDISVINTPPVDRRSIRTRLLRFSDYIIKEAINREIQRQGQIYFIHNRVETILHIGEYLNTILPKVRVAVAHGQMSEKNLEQIMLDFINRKYDLLLATTIVESGLDIPNVNTIIVNNAHKFGLSQLYQLRGRVGRSHSQAYAYLMIPGNKTLTETAQKRLSVLQELSHLGSGFKVAGYDLELRGAGNLLGSQQSGHIAAVGFELYTDMVKEAVAKIAKGEEEAAPEQETSLNLTFEANLPDDYISGMNQRLEAYKNISSCKTEEELWENRDSLEDRFGKPPKPAVNLFHKALIKLLAAELDITQISQYSDGLEIVFSENFSPDHDKFFAFLGSSGHNLKLLPDNKLKFYTPLPEPEMIIGFLTKFQKEAV